VESEMWGAFGLVCEAVDVNRKAVDVDCKAIA